MIDFQSYQHKCSQITGATPRDQYGVLSGITHAACEYSNAMVGDTVDREAALEALGDAMFIIARACTVLGEDMERVALESLRKMKMLHPPKEVQK